MYIHSYYQQPTDDRFGLALFIAAAIHLVIILGVSFEFVFPKNVTQSIRSIEVTLVHSKTEKEPEDADYLAQANQQGGGEVAEKVSPSSPLPNPRPVELPPGLEEITQPQQTPQQKPQKQQQKLITTSAKSTTTTSPSIVQKEQVPLPEAMPDINQLVIRSREIARLSAEIREQQQLYAKKPKRKYISANSKEYLFASYEDSWRRKVERIGNLNYPEEAKRDKISGTLLLDVAIRADGKLDQVKILKSSGNKILDDSAIYIVKMAAPFAPFTAEMRKQVDILHITRTWQFHDNQRFYTR